MSLYWFFNGSPANFLADLFAGAADFLFLGNAPANAGGWL